MIRREEPVEINGVTMSRQAAERAGLLPVTFIRCLSVITEGSTLLPREFVYENWANVRKVFPSNLYMQPLKAAPDNNWYGYDGYGNLCLAFYPNPKGA